MSCRLALGGVPALLVLLSWMGVYKIVNGASDSAGVTFSKSGTSDGQRI